MAASRRMTRNVQIGLSHSEKAKKLSFNGFYGEALKELNIALRAFETENRDGRWDDAVAGVLNNAGFVYLFTGNYQGAEDTFRSARSLKERLGDQRSLAGTLAGLADAYRGQCKFDEASDALDDALAIAAALKDNGLVHGLMANLDALERTRCDLPGASCEKAEYDELYVPREAADVTVKLAHLSIRAAVDELRVEADIGFPYLMNDLGGNTLFPALAFLFPKGVDSDLKGFMVTDEEEVPVGASASAFDGLVYGPGSYHRGGPMPMPACKEFIYTYGAGHVISWNLGANGWYHVEAAMGANSEDGMRLCLALPFGSLRLRAFSIALQGNWSAARLAGGTFKRGRALETAAPSFSEEHVLYEGRGAKELKRDTALSLKYGILCLDLIK